MRTAGATAVTPSPGPPMSNASMVTSATAGQSSASADSRSIVSSMAGRSAGSPPAAPVSRG